MDKSLNSEFKSKEQKLSDLQQLLAISPIDGRYKSYVSNLKDFSEYGLIKSRIIIEIKYLQQLSVTKELSLRNFTKEENELLNSLANISEIEALRVKEIEKVTRHDVKAVEYYLKEKLKETSLNDVLEWIHIALTSEDINNLAYALMLTKGIEVVLNDQKELINKIVDLSYKYKDISMLARTHGQPATPTTLGKELAVFAYRLTRQYEQLKNFKLQAKLAGASGNYNAHQMISDLNWPEWSRHFILSLNKFNKIDFNPMVTQIESHDTYIELFDIIKRFNNILIDFNQDIWRYISDNYLIQKAVQGEIGSSAMPHKVNPIDFEGSEGNLSMANALSDMFARKLAVSRLQRDLSDSTVERNFGSFFAFSLIAYQNCLRGLNKIEANEIKILEELNSHPEVIAEAIQNVLRVNNYQAPYELLKELTRGKDTKLEDISNLINSLDIGDTIKKQLLNITPENYIGEASNLVNNLSYIE